MKMGLLQESLELDKAFTNEFQICNRRDAECAREIIFCVAVVI